MIPSLEELRRRLLQPVPGKASTPNTLSNPDEDGSSVQDQSGPPPTTDGLQAGDHGPGGQITRKLARDEDRLAQVAARVFTPVSQYRDRIAEIEQSINQLTESAGELFGPLRSLRDQMQVLLTSREPMVAFQKELGTLAQSFAPMEELQGQMVQISEAFGAYLSDLSRSLEPAKTLDAPLSGLAETFRSASRLQAEFHELSETFRAVSRADSTKGTGSRGPKHKRRRHDLRLIEAQRRDAGRQHERD
jgi:hypothetical protein